MKHIRKPLILLLSVLMLAGCGKAGPSGQVAPDASASSVSAVSADSRSVRTSADSGFSLTPAASEKTEKETNRPAESWTGDDREGVKNYLAAYDRLPSNYMTKKEARAKGWKGGALHLVLPGKCIGGDRFGNYEERLPENPDYRECDIDTLHSDQRGAKRLIYSLDGDDLDIWYTEDHYNHFTLIYGDGK